jgi:hypothetical protein
MLKKSMNLLLITLLILSGWTNSSMAMVSQCHDNNEIHQDVSKFNNHEIHNLSDNNCNSCVDCLCTLCVNLYLPTIKLLTSNINIKYNYFDFYPKFSSLITSPDLRPPLFS